MVPPGLHPIPQTAIQKDTMIDGIRSWFLYAQAEARPEKVNVPWALAPDHITNLFQDVGINF